MLDLIVPPNKETTSTVTTRNAKTGSITTRVQRPAEFKEIFKQAHPDASNRAVKKAYLEYVNAASTAFAKGFDFQKAIALAQAGKLGIKSVRVNADGNETTVGFLDLSEETASADEITEKLDKMSTENLQYLLEYLNEKLQKPE